MSNELKIKVQVFTDTTVINLNRLEAYVRDITLSLSSGGKTQKYYIRYMSEEKSTVWISRELRDKAEKIWRMGRIHLAKSFKTLSHTLVSKGRAEIAHSVIVSDPKLKCRLTRGQVLSVRMNKRE
ncbi:hypothetical protein [Campylobacter jejuni]|uniref:Uncharacterized protein n=1 Tax=Campylobacter jejuni TaxID=197 RepID=A0A431EEE2_CAMJU|nr:hypothetical protein [Campylobacter jejuni]RTJ79626.1 hypothetical protein C3H57_04445 [Campylobacter jejuni]